MNENIETGVDAEKPTEQTMQEFRHLVWGLTKDGWYNRDAAGKKIDRERDYVLPDGRTMRASKLVDKEYDTGVELVFSESGVSQDGKPYTMEHSYTVYDYGGTSQRIRAIDEQSEKRANFRTNLFPSDEERQLEQEVGLDHESLERQWELEGIAQTGRITTISETELRELTNEVYGLKNGGQLDPLPAKDIPAPTQKTKESKLHKGPFDTIQGAAKAASSLIYQAELASAEPAKVQSVAKLKELVSEMSESGQIINEAMDYFEPPEASYKSSHYRLINEDEAEVRKFIHPSHSYLYEIIIQEYDKKDSVVIEKKFWLGKDGKLSVDINQPGEDNDGELISSTEDQAEAEEAAEMRWAGQSMGVDMGLHDVSEKELTRLIGLLKTAEPVTE